MLKKFLLHYSKELIVGTTGGAQLLSVFNMSLLFSVQNIKMCAHKTANNINIDVISSPVGSLCHTHGVVRRPSFVIRRISCVIFTHHNYQK